MAEYIEREAALKFGLTANLRHEKITVAQAVADAIAAYIKSLPAADVRPVVHGKWIVEAHKTYYDTRCSACGVKSFVSIEPKDTISFCSYCPNCGAKMEVD